MRAKARKTLERRAANGSQRAATRLAGRKKTPGMTKQMGKAADKASAVLGVGQDIGSKLLPEVFGGAGLDRVSFDKINPGQLDFASLNKYLQPSVAEAERFRDDTGSRYDQVLSMREGQLGGLNAAENQALKESLFRDIDRGAASARRDIARTPGVGAGSAFAQRRALGRDVRDAGIGANRQLLLDNIGLKRQALDSFEGTTANRQGAMSAAGDRLAAMRGTQAAAQQAVDNTNITNRLGADQFNASGNFAANQFNAGQQGKEIAAKVGAISAGTGIFGDERDNIQAKKKEKKLLEFLAGRDKALFEQAQALF